MRRQNLFSLLCLLFASLVLVACEDDKAEDCKQGTECPRGGCLDGICVTVCDDPCAGRDDLVCIIDQDDVQYCASANQVSVDDLFTPVASGSGSSAGADAGASGGDAAGGGEDDAAGGGEDAGASGGEDDAAGGGEDDAGGGDEDTAQPDAG